MKKLLLLLLIALFNNLSYSQVVIPTVQMDSMSHFIYYSSQNSYHLYTKNIFQYNASLRIEEDDLYYLSDTSGSYYRSNYTYNIIGLPTQVSIFRETDSSSTEYWRDVYVYDSNGMLTEYQDWDYTNSPDTSCFKRVSFYNSFGLPDSIVNYSLPHDDTVFFLFSVNYFEYDSSHKLVQEIDYGIESPLQLGFPHPQYMREINYDNNGRLGDITTSRFDTAWYLYEKTEYGYDNANNNTSVDTYKRDSTNSNWVNYLRILKDHDNYGYMTHQDNYVWKPLTSSWLLNYFKDLEWDFHHNLTEIVHHGYDYNQATLFPTQKEIYEYNTLNHKLQALMPLNFYADTSYEDQPLSKELLKWNKDSLVWVPYQLYEYYYSPILSIPPAEDNVFIRVYPNPASDFIVVSSPKDELCKMRIFTIEGKEVKAEYVNNLSRISLTDLAPGLYLYSIEGYPGLGGKFVKK